MSVAFIALSGLWLSADVVANDGELRQIQGWVLIPQIALAISLIMISVATRARSLMALASLLSLVVLEEHFHLFTPFGRSLEDALGFRNEIPWQAMVVVPAALAVISYTYLLAPQFLRPSLRNLTLFLFIAWFFGGPVNVVGRLLDSRALQLVEEFGEALGFSLAAGYGVGLVMQTGFAAGRSSWASRG